MQLGNRWPLSGRPGGDRLPRRRGRRGSSTGSAPPRGAINSANSGRTIGPTRANRRYGLASHARRRSGRVAVHERKHLCDSVACAGLTAPSRTGFTVACHPRLARPHRTHRVSRREPRSVIRAPLWLDRSAWAWREKFADQFALRLESRYASYKAKRWVTPFNDVGVTVPSELDAHEWSVVLSLAWYL